MEYIEQIVLKHDFSSLGKPKPIEAVASRGVSSSDLEEMIAWSLAEERSSWPPEGVTFHFHPLPSGASAIGRTTITGPPRPEGTTPSFYTQYLVAGESSLSRFCNNPLSLYQAALEQGKVGWYRFLPGKLKAFRLKGMSAAIDPGLLASLARNPGPAAVALLLQSALDSICTLFCEGPPAHHVIAGLLQCLPMQWRKEFSFSTNLHFSPLRPYRVIGISGVAGKELRRLQREYVLPLIDLKKDSAPLLGAEEHFFDSWPRLIYYILQSGQFEFLQRRLSYCSVPLDRESLHRTALRWLDDLREDYHRQEGDRRPQKEHQTLETWNPETSDPDEVSSTSEPDHLRRGDHPHVFELFRTTYCEHQALWSGHLQAPDSPVQEAAMSPAKKLARHFPEWEAQFQLFDTLATRALFGDTSALSELKEKWSALSSDLPLEKKLAIEEEYIRMVRMIVTMPRDPASPKDTTRSLDALEVLHIFLDGELDE
jgi:hypothetical protein